MSVELKNEIKELDSNKKIKEFNKLGRKNPKITVLLCTLNEEKNLPYVLPQIPSDVFEVLIVDGHSKDNTVQVAKQLLPSARILFQPGKGKGDALRYGIKLAKGDIIVTLDADGSMTPNEIPLFIKPLLEGYDFVKGSRFLPGGGTVDMSNHRKFGNYIFTVLSNILYKCKYTDITYGFNSFWKKTFKFIDYPGDGFEYEIGVNIRAKRAGLNVAEVPCFESKRINGAGKLHSIKDGWRILKAILKG